jgi:protein-S-isoprenylcysteine O-methyltransferase Ste14
MAICILAMLAAGAAFWPSRYPLAKLALFVPGVTLASFGAAGRAWATSYISGHKLSQLTTAGPYSLCRHPLYFFNLILGLGLGFCTETFTIPLIIAVSLTLLSYFQIKEEELRLQSKFGAQYELYMANVPRFLPRHLSYSEPEELTISAKVMRRGLFGVGFLLALIGLLEFLKAMHVSGFLPALFRIY